MGCEELREQKDQIRRGGGELHRRKQKEKGKLTARERLSLLFDEGRFTETNVFLEHRTTAFGMDAVQAPSDGVVTGYGLVEGRTVCAFAEDFTVLGGSIGEMHTKKIVQTQKMADRLQCPIVGLYDSVGARIQEGVLGLAGLAEVFYWNTRLSGRVPQISAIMGPCAGGAVYSPALTDVIFQVKHTAQMFLTGPDVVKKAIGETATMEDLGGSELHAKKSGVIHFEEENDETCLHDIRRLLSYLPQNASESPLRAPEKSRRASNLRIEIPEAQTRAYDMRNFILSLADADSLMEMQREFAPNILTCLCRLDGRVVGVVASQPSWMAGCLDLDACDQGARFVRFCDCYDIPLLTLVDVPGFMPGTKQEAGGIIRHGAKLLYAYSEASVPKITVIVRKAFGGAYIAMCSKGLGADLVYALPTASIAVLGADSAVDILYRKELKTALDPVRRAEELKAGYEQEFSNPYRAAKEGFVSDIVEANQLRSRLIFDYSVLSARQRTAAEHIQHGNIPL